MREERNKLHRFYGPDTQMAVNAGQFPEQGEQGELRTTDAQEDGV